MNIQPPRLKKQESGYDFVDKKRPMKQDGIILNKQTYQGYVE